MCGVMKIERTFARLGLLLVSFWLGFLTRSAIVSEFGFGGRFFRSQRINETELILEANAKLRAGPNHTDWITNGLHEGDTAIGDVYISIKTGGIFHETRIELLLRTWWSTAKDQVFIFTDKEDERLNNITGGRLIVTKCGTSHGRRHLSCKLGYEYDHYMDSEKKWWCHFDDDNYVNIYALLALLRNYTWEDDVYVGKISKPQGFRTKYKGEPVHLMFATGGAGYCISKSLARKMAPWSRNGTLLETSNAINMADDCTVGFVITNRLGVKFTVIDEFHSHLENLSAIASDELMQQISVSYDIQKSVNVNKILIPPKSAIFSEEEDPTRLLSLHCMLHPKTWWCKSMMWLKAIRFGR